MINQEEQMHKILTGVHHQDQHGSFICIPSFIPPKMKELIAELAMVEERVPRKSGSLKAPSPLRYPPHPSPKTRERISPESNGDLLPKSLSSTLHSEENNQNWHPNKLSESIMKLLRTSRAIELEKSGPTTSRFTTPLSTRSFKVENILNPKSSLALQKQSRQQDPYGIFDLEESIPRDIGPYKNLVIFTSSSIDTKCISSSSSIPLLEKLSVLMNNLQKVDLRALTYQQKLAFWINIHNACIMHGYLQYGMPNTPEKLLELISKATLNVKGNTVSAQAMEQYIQRKPTPSNIKESLQVDYQKVNGSECHICSVLWNSIFPSSEDIYSGGGVAAEMEKSKLEYLQASIVATNTKKIAVPELLLRNMFDFAMDTNSLVQWVCQ
ncbi:hypothetical protein PTKIN_Ptkin11bG0011200 [Pterospermum kingtungense]